MSELEEKTPRYVFSGKTEHYPTWGKKYLARANVKKFDAILKGTVVLRTKTDIDNEGDTTIQAKDEEIVEMNLKAYNDLLLSIDTDTADGNNAFDIVTGTVTEEYPAGNAKLAWDELKLECEPTTTSAYIDVKTEFQNRKLEEGEKPATWLSELEKMRKRLRDMKHPVSDDDFFIHIIGNLPMKYRDERKDFKRAMDNGNLTLKYIKDELKIAFEDFYPDGSVGDKENGEGDDVALAVGTFKGYCNNCGKYGHKRADCPELKQDNNDNRYQNNGGQRGGRFNGGRRFNGNCYHCGKRGHRKSECRSNPENQKRNANEGNGTGPNEETQENEIAEVMLMATEMPLVETKEKKYFWYDWCEECDDDEIVVQTYVESEDSDTHANESGLQDNFFDNFAGDSCDFDAMESDAEWNDYVSEVSGEYFEFALTSMENGNDVASDDDSTVDEIPALIMRHQADDDSSVYSDDTDSVPELIARDDRADDASDSDDETIPDLVEGFNLSLEHYTPTGPPDRLFDPEPETLMHDIVNFDIDDDEPPPLIERMDTELYDSDDSSDDDSYFYDDDGTATVDTESSIDDEVHERLYEFAMANLHHGPKWKEVEMKLTKNTWFGDSAASTHMCTDDTGMYDWKPIREEIKVGSGKATIATKVGKLKLRVQQTDGRITVLELTNVKYVPGMWCNLFSLTAALDKGFDLGNHGRIITISKNDAIVGFDRVFPTNTGFIMAAEMEQLPLTAVFAVLEAGREIDIHAFHEMYGHPGERVLRNTASAYDLKLTKKLDKCENCALSKKRQANVSKDPVERCDTPGKRLMIDISSVKKKSAGGNKFWLAILDDATDHVFSKFLKKKSELSATMINLVKDLNAKGFDVKTIRCDRAGENLQFQQDAIAAELGLTFEFTAPNTPQRNGRIERKFATLYGRTRSMLNSARITDEMRGTLWAEGAATATKLEDALIYEKDDLSSHEKFWKSEPKYARYLRKFGEMAVIKIPTKIKGKLKDRGKTVMFVGYADDSSPDTYRFYDPKTKRINISRDATWLNKNYGDWKGIKRTNIRRLTQQILLEADDDADPPTTTTTAATAPAATTTTATAPTAAPTPATTTAATPTEPPPDLTNLHPRARRELQWHDPPDLTLRSTRRQTRLATAHSESGREEAHRAPETQAEEMIDFTGEDDAPLFPNEPDVANIMFRNLQWPDLALHATEIMMEAIEQANTDGEPDDDVKYIEPKNFQEAWNHPDEYQRTKWREAIRKEFHDMIQRGVWRTMKRRDLPQGRRCAKNKWVWKIKRNGVFRARLVVCGYSQIPGVDYQEHFAPVINDITWRILLIAMMIWKLDAWLIDIETAFLHGEFEDGERAFMNLPTGMDLVEESIDPREDCIELLRTAYGTVQGARQWWKKLVSILRKIGFEGGDADPCLLHWNSPHGIVFIGLYVGDCLCIGKKEALELLEKKFEENGLTVKTERELKDYLSCDVTFNHDKTKAILRQPHLLKTLKEDFGDLVSKLPKYRTPGTPGQGLVRSNDGETVTPEEHKLYRSGTGKLLYLVKHSRPDIANAVRELSKLLDGTTPRAMKEMKRIIKYVLDTPELGLKIEPTIENKDKMWRLVAFSDSDYAGDPDSRRSVSGYVIYLCGVPICWRSKAQRTVTLSSTEAEWIALSEVAKEVLFIAQILKSMGIKVDFPIVIRVDNTAAIFLANNVTTNQRTRHVDIRTKFVMQYTGADGILKIIFVKGIDNDSDIMTKNVTGDLHDKHIPKMMNDETI